MSSSAGQDLVAGRMPGERIAEQTPRTSSSSTTTTTTLETDSVTAPLVTGRKYRATLYLKVRSDVAGDVVLAGIFLTDVTGTRLNGGATPCTVANLGFALRVEAEYTATADGDVVFKGGIERQSGSGNVSSYASSIYTALLYVDYING